MAHPTGLAIEVKPGLTPVIKERVYDLRYSVYLEFIDYVSDKAFATVYPELDRYGQLTSWYVRFKFSTGVNVIDYADEFDSLDDAVDEIHEQYNIVWQSRFNMAAAKSSADLLNDAAAFQIQECFGVSERSEVGSPVHLQTITVDDKYTVEIESRRDDYTIGGVPKIRHYYNHEWADGTIQDYTLHILCPKMCYSVNGYNLRWVIESGFGDMDNKSTFYYIDLTEAVVDVNYKLKVALDCYTEQMPFFNSARDILKEFVGNA